MPKTYKKTEEDRLKILNSHKWYTYEEAETELRKHFNPDYDHLGDYITMKRAQIQKIIRQDIIGTFLGIDTATKGMSEEEITYSSFYGWKKTETFFLDLDDGSEKECTEELFVFPKRKKDDCIILSSLDEQLGDSEKVELRETYERYHRPSKGKLPYLMTKSYLLALKLELERREYPPSTTIGLKPRSPKELLSELENCKSIDEVLTSMEEMIVDFKKSLNEKVNIHQGARDAEFERHQRFCQYLNERRLLLPEKVERIIVNLERDGLITELNQILERFNTPFQFSIDTAKKMEKVKKRYSQSLVEVDKELLKKAKDTIYQYEVHELHKFEEALIQDEKFKRRAVLFRFHFATELYRQILNVGKDDLLIRVLSILGIEDWVDFNKLDMN